MQIKKAKIRGVASEGMLCAEDELGLGDNHDGIVVLDEGLPVGTPFAVATGLSDVVIDFEVTPNRPDCLSLLGIAREVHALTGKPPPLSQRTGARKRPAHRRRRADRH